MSQFQLSELFTNSRIINNCSPFTASACLAEYEGHLPLHIFQLCSRLIVQIHSISGEDSERRRQWLSASVIAFIVSLAQGDFSPVVNANRFLAQSEQYDTDSVLRHEILSFGFQNDEQSQIPWYSDEGEGYMVVF